MRDSYEGTPGTSGINNLNDLLQKTKIKYNLIHHNDKRWPCPFCLNKERTLFQCKVHIRKDHANLMNEQFNHFALDDSASNNESDNTTPKDLTDFLHLINDTSSEDHGPNENDLKNIDSNEANSRHTNTLDLNYSEDEDEETFYCP